MIDNRIFGAMAIALAGILFGFTTGRLSAWLVPPAGMASVGSTAKPSVPLKPAPAVKQPASTAPDGAAAADHAAKPTRADGAATSAEPTQVEASAPSKPTPGSVTSRALSPGEPQRGTGWTDADTKLINPGSTQASDRQLERETASGPSARPSEGLSDELRPRASYEGLERCRQKYRSFDPSIHACPALT